VSDGLLHVTRFIDRHGRERVYVRNPNNAKRKKSIPLTAPTGTPEFMRQYHQAIKTLGLSATPVNAAAPRGAETLIDYYDLLGRYMLHVLRRAGDDFTGGDDFDASGVGFSAAEIAALERLSNKAGRAS
jgi:hypothetical protein